MRISTNSPFKQQYSISYLYYYVVIPQVRYDVIIRIVSLCMTNSRFNCMIRLYLLIAVCCVFHLKWLASFISSALCI